MEAFCEQCHNLVSGLRKKIIYILTLLTAHSVSGIYKTSCKTGEGVEEMFTDIARQLAISNRSRKELQAMEETSFQVAGSGAALRGDTSGSAEGAGDSCSC